MGNIWVFDDRSRRGPAAARAKVQGGEGRTWRHAPSKPGCQTSRDQRSREDQHQYGSRMTSSSSHRLVNETRKGDARKHGAYSPERRKRVKKRGRKKKKHRCAPPGDPRYPYPVNSAKNRDPSSRFLHIYKTLTRIASHQNARMVRRHGFNTIVPWPRKDILRGENIPHRAKSAHHFNMYYTYGTDIQMTSEGDKKQTITITGLCYGPLPAAQAISSTKWDAHQGLRKRLQTKRRYNSRYNTYQCPDPGRRRNM